MGGVRDANKVVTNIRGSLEIQIKKCQLSNLAIKWMKNDVIVIGLARRKRMVDNQSTLDSGPMACIQHSTGAT